jgi:hypothetical protein
VIREVLVKSEVTTKFVAHRNKKRRRKGHADRNFFTSIRKYKEPTQAPRASGLLACRRATGPVISPWVAEAQGSLTPRHSLVFVLHEMPPKNLRIIKAVQRIESTVLQVFGIHASHRGATRRTGGQRKGKPPTSTWGLETREFFFLSNTFDWIRQI